MTLSAPTGFASSDLVYEENFSGTALDSDWHTYITSNAANGWAWNSNGSGGSTPGGPYNADYDMPSQVSVSNGTLDLTAIKQPISGINQGGVAQTFPITSGAVSSYGNFEFNGGYLQISMKAPSGGGAWPGLWLMPGDGAGSSGDNFELDIQEGGFTGSGPADNNFSWHLHGPSGWVGDTIDSGINLTGGFHTYGINWVPGESITWYLDGQQMAQVTSAQVAIPDEPMQLMMNMGVANSNASGWHTALDGSTPSSMQMQIDGVQLYQKAGSGDTVTGANVAPSTTSSIQTPTTAPTTPTTSTTPTTPTRPTTPSVIAPVLTIADPTLDVNGLGGTVDLGVKVTTTDPNDLVTVMVTGLPKYETITDKLDGKTFSGKSITLTAAQVDSGLTLQSNYRGAAHPVATLTLTATAKDPATGAVSTASPQTIAVTDPRPAATTTSPRVIAQTDHEHAPARSLASLSTRRFAWLNEHRDLVAGTAKTLASQNITMADHPLASGTSRASLASQSFALLNQYLAGNSGHVDHGQIVASLSNGTNWNHDSYLTRPQH
ncbi:MULTISPECIES: glycoside hydrolase family 16 protein [unclassified Mesorhizobium]|uniref:glycoside hydrolase family 16 protein n=1 Tax=unclassified Mesorhizobium TaxID=325217 RepID=UPI0016732618|nr:MULTISPECIES: glycoside hydrolase family 16 protein [unclassified Mesorhizobium]